jgi:hypothetical protein
MRFMVSAANRGHPLCVRTSAFQLKAMCRIRRVNVSSKGWPTSSESLSNQSPHFVRAPLQSNIHGNELEPKYLVDDTGARSDSLASYDVPLLISTTAIQSARDSSIWADSLAMPQRRYNFLMKTY